MHIAFRTFLLVVGFALLVQSAKIFVNASVGIAKRLKIPTLVIGLTVVAMGTSAPEVVVGVSAALSGSSELAIANVVGSNLFNLLFIVGFCAMLYPISLKMTEISRDYWVSFAATVLLLVLAVVFAGRSIPRWGGFVFIAGFVIYMFVIIRHTLKNKAPESSGEESDNAPPLWKNIILAIVGIVVIVEAGQLTVTSAVNIADHIGISERIIGLTIVSIGTSLPELVTTLIACRKNEGGFAIGFIIGSSIFNILFVLGLAGMILPLEVERSVIFDISVLVIGTLAFFMYAKSGMKLVRVEGFFMVLMYIGYIVWLLI